MRWIAGCILGVAVLAGIFLYRSIRSVDATLREVVSTISTATPVTRQLGDHLGEESPQAVAVLSKGQWHLITDVDAARNATFSYQKTGLLGAILGMGTCPSADANVVVEPLVDGLIVRRIDSCAGPQTDVSGLVARGVPVQAIESGPISRQDWQVMAAEVAANPARFAANFGPVEPFDYRCSQTFPHVWADEEDTRAYIMTRYEDAIRGSLASILNDEETAYLWIENGYSSSYVMHPAEGLDTSAESWAVGTDFTFMTRGAERRKIPGVSLYRPKITLQGRLADCEAFARMDFQPIWQDDRDIAVLQAAWSKGVTIEPGAGTHNNWDEVLALDITRQAPAQNLAAYRYFQLP